MTTTIALNASWTQSHGCLATNDLWMWNDGTYTADVLGAPMATSCFPESYQPTATIHYSGASCPDGFAAACATGSLTTCCPTAYSFSCAPFTVGLAEVPCSWDYTTGFTAAFTSTSFRSIGASPKPNTFVISAPTSATVTTSGGFPYIISKGTDGALGAMGLVVVTPTDGSTTEPSTTSASSDPSQGSSNGSSSGLSAGAAAGIGVAAATCACALIGIGVWLVYLRRPKSSSAFSKSQPQPSGWYQQQTYQQTYDAGPGLQKPHPVEMQTPQQRHELETSRI